MYCLYVLYIFGCVAFYWSMVNLLRIILFNKTDSPTSRSNSLAIAPQIGAWLLHHLARDFSPKTNISSVNYFSQYITLSNL